jgi:hypothetical protein
MPAATIVATTIRNRAGTTLSSIMILAYWMDLAPKVFLFLCAGPCHDGVSQFPRARQFFADQRILRIFDCQP